MKKFILPFLIFVCTLCLYFCTAQGTAEVSLKNPAGMSHISHNSAITADAEDIYDNKAVTGISPLLVQLPSFTSRVFDNNVTLYWTTVMEENNSGFDVERNLFGIVWSKIGFVAGNGTTNQTIYYTYKDNGLNTGRYYYRLKQIDFNGNFKYHDLRDEVVIGVPENFNLSQNYPNPFNPVTKIKFRVQAVSSSNSEGGIPVQLKVYDVTGRVIQTLVDEALKPGYYEATFDAALPDGQGTRLNSGVYLYSLIIDGEFIATKKAILLK